MRRRFAERGEAVGEDNVRAPMPGRIVVVKVKARRCGQGRAGTAVIEGDEDGVEPQGAADATIASLHA
jgi:hypothetical protein